MNLVWSRLGFAGVLLALMLPCGRSQAAPVDPALGRADPDGTNVWFDCARLPIEGKGWTNTAAPFDRLPAGAQGVVPASVWGLSRNSAGLCLRFTTDASSFRVRWTLLNNRLDMPHMPATGVSGVDLYAKDASGAWQFRKNGQPKQVTNDVSFSASAGQECLLYLPLYNGVTSVEIGLPKGHTLSMVPTRPGLKPVVFYGTSITQGGCASRPGLAATAIAGRYLDVPVINLGFSGSGKMEPELADLLAGLDPSVYVLDCLWNMKPDMVTERIAPFVRKLRAAHPDTPILLAEDSNYKNAIPTDKGRLLRDIFATLQREGVKNLHFVSGEDMLGTDLEGTVDGCHPNDIGMLRQAGVFAKALAPILRAGR